MKAKTFFHLGLYSASYFEKDPSFQTIANYGFPFTLSQLGFLEIETDFFLSKSSPASLA